MILDFLEVLDRAHTGPLTNVKEWDMKIVPGATTRKLKEHGLQKTCTPENPINTDDGLVREFWKAGFELAVELGMLCLTTERLIKFDENELKAMLRESPLQVKLGDGQDEMIIKPRKPEDKTPPKSGPLGPFGIAIDEEIYRPVHMSIARHRIIDAISPGSLHSMHGREIRSKTPYETLAGKYEGQLLHQALDMVGRPNMASDGALSSITEYGQLGGFLNMPGGFSDHHQYLILTPVGLKTTYTQLHKVAHAVNLNAPIQAGGSAAQIGVPGPAEDAAVLNIAGLLLLARIHMGTMFSAPIYDSRFISNSTRDCQWANSIAYQARDTYTRLLSGLVPLPRAGPCTEMLLHEVAAVEINATVSGIAFQHGIFTAGGGHRNRVGTLECVLAAEIGYAAAGMKRSDANEIVKALIPKFETKIRDPPLGKTFQECFNLKTIEPSKEWKEMYEKVWKELEDLGLERDRAIVY